MARNVCRKCRGACGFVSQLKLDYFVMWRKYCDFNATDFSVGRVLQNGSFKLYSHCRIVKTKSLT